MDSNNPLSGGYGLKQSTIFCGPLSWGYGLKQSSDLFRTRCPFPRPNEGSTPGTSFSIPPLGTGTPLPLKAKAHTFTET